MKCGISALALAMAIALPPAYANKKHEEKHEETTEVSESHNPITDSTTVTETTKKHKKVAGKSRDMTVTKKTKYRKDGSVQKSTDVEVETESDTKHD